MKSPGTIGQVIGLIGQKQAGKDTVCRFLTEILGDRVRRLAFADRLKEEVAKGCGVSTEFLEANKENFRLILQGWGTDFRRELFGCDYWVRFVEQELINVKDYPERIYCVTDVRFPNEVALVRKFGGVIIRVVRGPEVSGDRHASERALLTMTSDITIENNQGLDELRAKVASIVEQLNDS